MLRGRDVRAHAVLQRIYRSSEAADEEIAAVHGTASASSKSEWRVLFEPAIRKAVVIGVFIAILGQFMGVNAVLYYGPTIFENAGLSSGDSLFSQVLVGVVNMLTSVLALVIIDRVGRKQLVYWGVSGMIVSLLCIGLYFMCGAALGLPNVFLLIFFPPAYIFCCAVFICAVVWVLLSEMYPHPGARSWRCRSPDLRFNGGHLSHQTADAVDARKPYARRHASSLFAACASPMLIIWRAVRNHGAFA